MVLKGWLYRLASILMFFILWHLSAYAYDSMFFPTPLEVGKSLLQLLGQRQNYSHIFVTMTRVFESIGIAAIIGSAIGILPRFYRPSKYFLETVIYPLFQSMPAIAWAFLAAVWFGLSPIAPIFILVAALLPQFFLNIFEGIKELDEDLMELGRSFTKSKIRIFKKIIFPLLYPYFFSAFRIGFSVAWKVVLVAEFFVATDGIGYMMSISRELYDVPRILAWISIILAIMIFFDRGVFSYIDRKTMRRWKSD